MSDSIQSIVDDINHLKTLTLDERQQYKTKKDTVKQLQKEELRAQQILKRKIYVRKCIDESIDKQIKKNKRKRFFGNKNLYYLDGKLIDLDNEYKRIQEIIRFLLMKYEHSTKCSVMLERLNLQAFIYNRE